MSETPPPPPAAPQPAAPMSPNDERMYVTLAHAGIILFGFLPPLIVWLIGKERSAFVDREAKEALNFSILISIIYVVCTVTSFLIIPLLIMLAAWIASIVFCIQGAMAANKGQDFRYPFNWRIIK
ncbi:DUF4870 domain-containing protein [Demequina sp. NBRC 110052]|uniref:DUF4870 domain-containing protein n=1 Tax=Demequina sp. NBRC 110052 TaxID=1570341 RepID=UPI001356374A|nr:DUF4870 domain-containing protein [Demequina sp. NBRC 110052]